MLPQEVEELPGIWSNNTSTASLHDHTLLSTTSQEQHDYENRPTTNRLNDISVDDILKIYKHDTELLKHILKAKTEEDKRRAAEEVRCTEEARLQSKYLDLGYAQQKQYSDPTTFTNEFLCGSLGSLAVSSAEVIPDWLSFHPDNNINMMTPMTVPIHHFDQTPPSPTTSYYQPPSPLPSTSLNAPFADLTISSTSSPELPSTNSVTTGNNMPSTKSSCKRTLSRTRSHRRPVIPPGKKKNRSSQQDPSNRPTHLDHGTVMEALRAKLRRSSNLSDDINDKTSSSTSTSLIWPTSLEEIDYPAQPMSSQGMLLSGSSRRMVSGNSKKRSTTINPKVAIVRRPKPFTSAHNHCEKIKDSSAIK
ncbi:hypothetical protein BC941DRAFT_474298 [Chlamydoabsidia padenii]|nr:hypothetical protein BC941DRAFT_474298 [Chlamydoabsidia padenii]